MLFWNLGRAKKGITGRYATVPDLVLVAAADKLSLALALALDGKKADNVVGSSPPANSRKS